MAAETVRAARNWHDLRLRLMSAAVLIPVAALGIWIGGYVYDALIVAVMIGMAYEGAVLLGLSARVWRGVLFLVWPVVVAAAALKGAWGAAFGVVGAGLLFGTPLWLVQIAAGIGGLSLLWLRGLPGGAAQVVFVIVAVIASDSCAYVAGRLFGGRKLAPAISPGKTWSGAIGGLVGATTAGAVMANLAGNIAGNIAGATGMGEVAARTLGGALTGALLGVVAQVGDLAESAAKRRLGVKDSGTLIPGHGGLFDRFDGLLAAAPVAALLSRLDPGSGAFWLAPVRFVLGG